MAAPPPTSTALVRAHSSLLQGTQAQTTGEVAQRDTHYLLSSAVDLNRPNIGGLDQNELNGSALVDHIFDPQNVDESARRLDYVLNEIQERDEEWVKRLATIFELLHQDDRLDPILSTSAELRARYYGVERTVKQRHRGHHEMARQYYDLTRQQVGDDWFNLCLHPYPTDKVTIWSTIKRLFNIAAQGNISVSIIWRTAHAITLKRLREGGRGVSKLRRMARVDVLRTEEYFTTNLGERGGGLAI